MKIRDFTLTIVIAFLIVAVLMNKSIHSYIEQKYHTSLFDVDNKILNLIRMPSLWLDTMRQNLFPNQQDLAIESINQAAPESQEPQEPALIPEERYPLITPEGRIILKPNSTFLLIGDSMMQGVGLTLVKELQNLNMNVINMSKQSTGLTYNNFFNWNQALKEAFNKNPYIDVVVMMVGANDPYNMPKIKFQSPLWIETYTSRIRGIINTALENNAIIVWYEAPFVRKEPLNTNLQFLNTLYREHIQESKQVFLESNAILSPDGKYTPYIKNSKGKSLKVRGSDGIHFSSYGSKLLSLLLLERLEILPQEEQIDEVKKILEYNNTQEEHKAIQESSIESVDPPQPLPPFIRQPATKPQQDLMPESTDSNLQENLELAPKEHPIKPLLDDFTPIPIPLDSVEQTLEIHPSEEY